jgi:hypothetical protein
VTTTKWAEAALTAKADETHSDETKAHSLFSGLVLRVQSYHSLRRVLEVLEDARVK